MIKIDTYNIFQFQFRELIEQALEVSELEKLHELKGAPTNIVKVGADNHTEWHNKFYKNCNKFLDLYHQFIKEFIRPIYFEPIVIQAKPTFRIHWKNNLAVGEFHRDSDYNHLVEELNYWIPVTDVYGNNGVWIESQPNKRDFHPMRLHYGKLLIFNGGELTHGNKVNDSEITRISFDFRVIKQSLYKESNNPSKGLGHGIERKLGAYYQLID